MQIATGIDVFISYSRCDAAWKDRLGVGLECLRKAGKLNAWDDTKIRTGGDWASEIADAIAKARVALLLISPDFLASDYIHEVELPLIEERSAAGGLEIFSVILRPSVWEMFPRLANIQHFDRATPLSSTEGVALEERLKRFAVELSEMVEALRGEPGGFETEGEAEAPVEEGTAALDEAEIRAIVEADRVLASQLATPPQVLDLARVFETERQTTWLVAVPGRVLCLLDDANTRAKARVIQWRLAMGPETPVEVRRMPGGSSFLFDLGQYKRWLASPGLFGNDTATLEARIRGLIDTARSG